jgi:hypothetical protein
LGVLRKNAGNREEGKKMNRKEIADLTDYLRNLRDGEPSENARAKLILSELRIAFAANPTSWEQVRQIDRTLGLTPEWKLRPKEMALPA